MIWNGWRLNLYEDEQEYLPRQLTTPVPLMRFKRRPQINWYCDGYDPDEAPPFNLCGLCGVYNPPFFHVPDTCWRRYIERKHRDQILCVACWRWLTEIIDGGAFEARHGGPLPYWSDAWRARQGIYEPCPMTAERLKDFTIQQVPSPRCTEKRRKTP